MKMEPIIQGVDCPDTDPDCAECWFSDVCTLPKQQIQERKPRREETKKPRRRR